MIDRRTGRLQMKVKVHYDNMVSGDTYTSYKGSNVSNQNSQKLEVFDRKLEGSHSLFIYHFDKHQRK